MKDGLGARLRVQRERKRIELAAIAQSTKINIALFEALERDDASRWPTGIFRRAFIRAYAEAIGLDPALVLREFLERFPDPSDEPHVSVARSDRIGIAPDDLSPVVPLRLTLADEEPSGANARVKALLARSQRAAAAACDLAIVIAITEAVFAVTHAFWTPFTVVTVCYYFGGILTLGNSPGGWLVGRPRKTVPIDPPMRPQPAESLHGTDNLRQFEPRHYTKAV